MENRKERLKVEIESLSKNEEFARVVVVVSIGRMNPALEEPDGVKTAVFRTVINMVIHGYQGKDGIIHIEASVEDGELTIIMRDKGVGIQDVKRAIEPMFTSDTTGECSDMGFSFMKAFMDEVRVESAPDEGTTVTMKKRIGG